MHADLSCCFDGGATVFEERSHGADEYVAFVQHGSKRGGLFDVDGRCVETSEISCECRKPSWVAANEHRAGPLANEAAGGEVTCVASGAEDDDARRGGHPVTR
nr:hypothetical protein [Tessaracoccus sp.]